MIVLTPDRLMSADPAAIASSHECVVAIGGGALSGSAAAVLMLSDYAVLTRGASVAIDSAAAWAGAVWRLKASAVHLLFAQKESFDAGEALAVELVDEVTDTADGWQMQFMKSRSTLAIDAAAMLISRCGGDALERAEFARLFAAGEPQRGLRAFLEKRSPRFD